MALPAITGVALLWAVAWVVLRILDGDIRHVDEWYTLEIALMGWGRLWIDLLTDYHPPLYYAFIKIWGALLGYGETSLRLPSFLAALAALGALFAAGRRQLSPTALWVALTLLGTHWYFLLFALEARPHAFVILGGAWCALAFARLWNKPRPAAGELFLFCLGALALALLQYTAMAFACSAMALLLFRNRRHPAAWALLGGTVALCAAVAAYHILHMTERGGYGSRIGFGVFLQLGPRGSAIGGGGKLLQAALHLMALGALLALLRASVRKVGSWRNWLDRREQQRGWAVFRSLLLLLLAYWMALNAVGLLYKPLWGPKSVLVVLPLLCVCVAMAAAWSLGSRPLLLAAVVGAWAAIALYSAAPMDKQLARQELDGIEKMLQRWEASGGDIRIYWDQDAPLATPFPFTWRPALTLKMDTGAHRPVLLRRGHSDIRHLVPPFLIWFAGTKETARRRFGGREEIMPSLDGPRQRLALHVHEARPERAPSGAP